MKRIFPGIFLFFPADLILLFFVSCGPAVLVETATPTPNATLELLATPSPDCLPENWPCPSDSMTLTAEMGPTLNAMLTLIPACDGLCPEDSMTATAAMGLTFAAIPSNTPPPWATIIPEAGDLGWGSVYGKIVDGVTGLPIEGATVTCKQLSDTSPYLCNGVTTTDSDGMYAFTDVFFRETDRIRLFVEAPGYMPLSYDVHQALIPPADFQTSLGLFPATDLTSTPTPFMIMCTPPACSDGVLVCGGPNECPGGCGAICLPWTPTP